jgi:hypothetical protein
MVLGKDLGFVAPTRGSIDTSCVLHQKELIRKYGPWKSQTEVGYAHDWELFRRWVEAGEKWAATGMATVDYNIETCRQKEYLKALVEGKTEKPSVADHAVLS